jgi:hypothetical protein
MKFLSIFFFLLLSFNAFSNDSYHKDMMRKMDNMSFDEAKKMQMEMIENKTSMMDQMRKCIIATNDKSALRGCMSEMASMHDEMKDNMKK